MLRNKAVTPNIENTLSQSINFEVTVVDLARRSERRAWFVAFSAIIMSLILAGGYYYMLPLKEKVPYLVMADAYTGTSTVARLANDLNYQSVTANEAINKSNVAHFVLARESYDYTQIGAGDWNTVHVMATNNVTPEYRALHAPTKLDSPFKLYGNTKAIRVKILSISLHGNSNDAVIIDGKGVAAKGPPTAASVRIQRHLFEKNTGATQLLDSKIITMEFSYNPNLKMTDEGRVLNPLGFQVTSYRADNDFSEAPPPEYQRAATPVPAPVAQPAEALVPGGMTPVPGTELPTELQQPASQVPADNSPNNVNGASNR